MGRDVTALLCAGATLQSGASSFAAGLSNQNAALNSDLLVHHMGSGLADNISQGTAGPDEFRTAPLWRVGSVCSFSTMGARIPPMAACSRPLRIMLVPVQGPTA
jgi:CxxC motif-containing protein (DUF1111 family)